MIIKKKVDNNWVRCSRAIKACNETILKKQLLHTIIFNFRKAVQILDVLQVLPKLPKCMKFFLQKFYILSMMYETLQR